MNDDSIESLWRVVMHTSADNCPMGFAKTLVESATLAERARCRQAIRDTEDRSGTNRDGQSWLIRAGRSDFIAALDAL